MNLQQEINKITQFIKIGLVVLTGVLLIAFGVKIIPKVVSVSSNSSGRELPIYCVNREEKKVALSFDAAWGNGKLG